jgi:WD40 repeat protein
VIVTFYSFKGGVGRSMALANVGEILADWGYRVVLCDWDLEAPGLERYFSPVENPLFSDPAAREEYDRHYKEMLAHEGLVELLREYKQTLTRTPEEEETPQSTDPDHVMVGKLLLRRPSAFTYVPPTRRSDDRLRILSAGRRENEDRLRQYAENVRDFDWTEFYDKWAGNAYIEFFRKELKGEHGGEGINADIVLVDSRTGVTEQGGVCTHHLADLVVLTTAPNEANIDGTAWMASSLSRNQKLEAMRGGRALAVLPVISRVEVFNERELYDDFEEYFIGRLTPYLPKAITEGPEFFRESRIPYATFYSFRERVVARETRERRQRELYRAYTQLAHGVVRHGLAAGVLADDHTPSELRHATTPRSDRPRRMLRGPVFISHSADDAEVAGLVAEALRKRGVAEVLPALSMNFGITADAAQTILPEAGTVFFVMGDTGMSESMRAELDFIVHQIASGKQTTIVTLLTSANVFASPLLVGYRAFALPADIRSNTEFFDVLIAETAGAPAPPIGSDDARPYPGLAPFREGDARFFFGRDDEIADLESAVADAAASPVRWLRVEGASGIGVSSIVSAGLIPAIRRGAVHGIARDAAVAVCSAAGLYPLLSLASALALAPAIRVEEVHAQLGKPGLPKYAELLLRGRPAVLVIEGLDTMPSPADSATTAFCAAIASLLDAKELPLTCVSTMRSGTLPTLDATPLAALARDAKVFEVSPIDGKRLREVIAGPATLAGMAFETGLPERIAGEAANTMNCPSFLASQLQRLCKIAKGRASTLITHAMYEETGSLARLAIDIAEEALRAFRGVDRELAQSILMRLVSGVETRLSRAVVALVAGSGGPEARELVLRRLVDARVVSRRLVKDGDEEAELTHDAILQAPTMAKWIADERVKIRQRSELELAARSWKRADTPWGGLPTGGQLRYFEKVETTSPEVLEFLAKARKFTWWRRLGFTALILFSAWVLWSWNRAPQSLTLKPVSANAGNDLADSVVDLVQRPNSSITIPLFLDAALQLKNADAQHTNRLLRALLNASVAPQTYTTNNPIVSFDLSDDGRVLAIAQRNRIELYDVPRHGLIGAMASEGTLARVSLNEDGSLLFIQHSDRPPEVWNVGGRLRWQLPRSLYQQGSDAVMSPDGHRVAMLDLSGILRIFTMTHRGVVTSRNPARITNFRPDVGKTLTFAPGGHRIVAFGEKGSLWVWDATGVLVLNGNEHDTKIQNFAFSSDGRLMVTYAARRIVTWDLARGAMRERDTLTKPDPAIIGMVVNTDGHYMLVDHDGPVSFRGLDGVKTASTAALTTVASLPGNRFLTASEKTIGLWSWTAPVVKEFPISARVTQFSVASKGRTIAAGEIDTSVELRIWDVESALTYSAISIPDGQLRTLVQQRLNELSPKEPAALPRELPAPTPSRAVRGPS